MLSECYEICTMWCDSSVQISGPINVLCINNGFVTISLLFYYIKKWIKVVKYSFFSVP